MRRRERSCCAHVLGGMLCLGPAAVHARGPPEPDPEPEPVVVAGPAWTPRLGPDRLHYTNLVGLRLNPEGLVDVLRVGYRRTLWTRPGAVFQGTYLDLKAHLFLNPSFLRVGPYLEIVPFAFLVATARYGYTPYWNAFGTLQSFPSARVDVGPNAVRAGQKNGDSYSSAGHVVTLTGRLQGMQWNVVLRDEVTAQWSKIDLRSDDRVYYEPTFDVLFPNGGWVLVNDLDLLYRFPHRLVLGARYTATHALYRDRHLQDVAAGVAPQRTHHRVGPAVLYTFFERPGARWDRPTLIVLTQWWVSHRYRTGRDVHAALPYLILAFSFEGQLLPWNRPYPRTTRAVRKRTSR